MQEPIILRAKNIGLRLAYEQWGMATRNTGGDSGRTRIKLPLAFSVACYAAVAVDMINASHAMYGALWKTPALSYFDYNADSDAVNIPWFAVGK